MSEESKKILEMLSQGKISVGDAEKLLEALKVKSGKSNEFGSVSGSPPEFLRVKVESKNGDNVNIRVPLKLVRAGLKLKSFIPDEAKQKVDAELGRKGFQFSMNDITEDNLEEFLEAFKTFNMDVKSESGDTVHIFCE